MKKILVILLFGILSSSSADDWDLRNDEKLQINQKDKNNSLPSDIKNFIESRKEFIKTDKTNTIQTMNELDEEFVALRKKYKENDFILNILSQFGCLLDDCSATSKGNGFVFYKDMDIAQAIHSSLMDRNTFTSYPFFKEIFKHNPNILTKKENFSSDLSLNSNYANYKKIDIVWSEDKTRIDFILYDEYFNKNICSHTAEFIRFKQEKEGVKAQIKEVNDFINKSCECIHIGGEEPYDEQRANELGEMAQGCNSIPKKRLELQNQYQDNIKILELLKREEENYKESFGE